MSEFPQKLVLSKAPDIKKFDDEVGIFDEDLRSDATVTFFINHFAAKGYELETISVVKNEDGLVGNLHYAYYKVCNKNKWLQEYNCSRVKQGCNFSFFIPHTATIGTRLAIKRPEPHTCQAEISHFDVHGRSVHLMQLVEAILVLIEAGLFNEDRSFKDGININLATIKSEQVRNAVLFFNKCRELNQQFEAKFINETDTKGTIYARLKYGLTEESSFIDRFTFLAYIGRRSTSSGDRLNELKREKNKTVWFKTVLFCTSERPITQEHLLLPRIDLKTSISAKETKASEALIQDLFVKIHGSEKLILNELNDTCAPEYRFENDFSSDHKNAAFILVRGLLSSELKIDNFTPLKGGKGNKINETKLNERLVEINGGLNEVDQLRADLEAMTLERDNAITERDNAISERDNANAEIQKLQNLLIQNGVFIPEGPLSKRTKKK